jgi:hypothetical protein
MSISDRDKQFRHLRDVDSKLVAGLHELREGRRGHPLMGVFLDDHVSSVVRRLLGEYAELAVRVSDAPEFHDWLVTRHDDLQLFAQTLPRKAVGTVVRNLYKPALWILSGGGAAILGLKLSNTCLC